jgi:hypothetical protein
LLACRLPDKLARVKRSQRRARDDDAVSFRGESADSAVVARAARAARVARAARAVFG